MKRLRTLVAGISFAALILIGLFYGIDRAARHEPQFYRAALEVEPNQHLEAGDALERTVLDLHNDARQPGRWQAIFSESHLNGWLASDLPEKFPSLLPRGTREPRVAIQPSGVKIACRYERGRVKTVISLVLDVAMTEETNQLAVRVQRVRAGALPVPLKQFLDPITRAAERSGVPVLWSQQDGDPVALITVPVEHEDYAHPQVYVETIELADGEVRLSGRSEADVRPLVAAVNRR